MSDFRVLPRIDEDNEFFWTSGREGVLRFLGCDHCGYLIHPPGPVCPKCWSRQVSPQPVSGRATLYSFTINHQNWAPGTEEPYVIGIVVPVEQDDIRLTTNVIGIDPGAVEIGMELEVVFEDRDPVFLPLFRPVAASATAAPRDGTP